jgi:RimJ/RimL family protein N-acetyltransferase
VITLDGHTLADAEAHLAGQDAEMRHRFEASAAPTLQEVRAAIGRWAAARAAGGPAIAYAVRDEAGVLMGRCEARLTEAGEAQVSYWIFPAFRGAGRAARALLLICEAAARRPGLRRIEAHIDADNAASRRTAARAGFCETGLVMDEAEAGGPPIQRVRYVLAVALAD